MPIRQGHTCPVILDRFLRRASLSTQQSFRFGFISAHSCALSLRYSCIVHTLRSSGHRRFRQNKNLVGEKVGLGVTKGSFRSSQSLIKANWSPARRLRSSTNSWALRGFLTSGASSRQDSNLFEKPVASNYDIILERSKVRLELGDGDRVFG